MWMSLAVGGPRDGIRVNECFVMKEAIVRRINGRINLIL